MISTLALLLLIAARATAPADNDQTIKLSVDQRGACHARFSGKDVLVDNPQVAGLLHIDPRRKVHLEAEPALPYQCVGAIIYVLQSHGVMEIGFTAEPKPAD